MNKQITGMYAAFGDDLLDICLNAERRVGSDDDLDILDDVAEQVTVVCRRLSARIDAYAEHCWRFRLIRLGAWLFWQSRWAADVDALDGLDDLCRRQHHTIVSLARAAYGYACIGKARWVTQQRDTALSSLWSLAGRCLTEADPR